MEAQPEPGPSAERPQKRPRTSTACGACRKRRAKCDGAKPACGRCTSLNLTCIFDFDNDKRKPVTKDVVTALELRIQALEQELADVKAEKASVPAPAPLTEGSSTPNQSAPFSAGLALNAHGELRFCGPTSSYRAILADANNESAVEAARAWSLTRAPVPNAPPLDPHLPRKPPVLSTEFSGKLIRLAFEHAFSQFGLVDERAFLADLATSATRRTPNYSPLLLHLVLGFGARYLDPNDPEWPREICSDVTDVATRGEVFIEWARSSVDIEFRHPDISTVRALTVLSVYLAGQALDGPAIMYGSQGLRMAEDFGLHLDTHHLQIGSGSIPETLRITRRNAFWAAFQVDCLNSVYIGLRPHFEVGDIDNDLPAIDSSVEYDHPAYRSSSFNASSKLMRILSKLLSTVYSLKPGVTLESRRAALPEIHLALERWYHELPSPLRASTPTPAKAPHCHILGLNAMYHATVILLHRPFFRRVNEVNAMSVSTEKCLSSAKHIVRLVRLQRERYGLRFTAPLFQHTCFTAGTILALSASESNISGNPHQDAERKQQAHVDLKALISALREMAVTWKTASTSANVLEAFMQQWSRAAGWRSTGAVTPAVQRGAAHGPEPDAVALALAAVQHQQHQQDGAAGSLEAQFHDASMLEAGAAGMSTLQMPPGTEAEPEQAWQLFTADLTATSFPHIFPSWDLAAGPGSSLDDFLSLLDPQPIDNAASFSMEGFGGATAAM
ncbi:Zn(II)2Cys6 transcription factor [Rhodotorula paludigena]|uniref:Zn(II)2Cys6 transcription factor n=1 Tax=Rhodotorula paludigena TaxID=86838 RepID=UPI003174957F